MIASRGIYMRNTADLLQIWEYIRNADMRELYDIPPASKRIVLRNFCGKEKTFKYLYVYINNDT